MVRTADLPYVAGGLDPPVPLDHPDTSDSGYATSLFGHPAGRAARSSGGGSHRHWPPYHAYSLNLRECRGTYDPPDHRPPHFDGHQPDHRDRARGAAGLSASIPPPPPPHHRAGYGLDSPSVVPAPDRHIRGGTSSGSPLRSRRESDISPVLIRSTEGHGYRKHQHHRARDESGRSPSFDWPLRGSKSVPLPERHGLEDGRKGSKSLPSSKRYRLEDGRKGSSSDRHWYDDVERSGSRGRYGGGRHTQELADPSTCDQEFHYPGDAKRNFSSSDHGKNDLSLRVKPPLLIPMKISPWDDGYKSPTSPTYYCEDVEEGLHGEDKNENPGWRNSDYDGSAFAGRDPNFKTEDLVLKTQKEDSAYNALVDDFMDAVMKSWCSPNANITVDEEAYQKQAVRFAELALKRYNKNKNNKVKYALVEAIVGDAIFEGCELYGHVNFYAKAKNGPKKNDGNVLVFAELHQVGRRLNAMVLTCFQLLDEKNQLCGCRDQVVRCFPRTQNQDMDHCYACSDRIKHPDGLRYKAGHFVDMLCYHYN